MSAIYFVIKCAIVTFFVVLLMQVRVGGLTIEQQAIRFIHGSEYIQPLQKYTDSLTVATRRTLRNAKNLATEKWNEVWNERPTSPEERSPASE